ncbi:hypothetical protein IWX91DRAFT_273300 [Phyllosticta citricarpa]
MIKIQSLLNPLSEASLGRHSPPPSPHLSDVHRQKVSKTAAVFVKGEPKGEVRYPPHEIDDDDELAAELLKYRITPTPLRDIKKYPRHIPYNSDKKSFLTKTGREAFEVFQYTYKVPGDSTEYVVMWDYNIGLTRITPFFKSCKYPKVSTTPVSRSNMLTRSLVDYSSKGVENKQRPWSHQLQHHRRGSCSSGYEELSSPLLSEADRHQDTGCHLKPPKPSPPPFATPSATR